MWGFPIYTEDDLEFYDTWKTAWQSLAELKGLLYLPVELFNLDG